MDSVLHSSFMRRGVRQTEEPLAVDDLVARFMVTKASWRGRYRRIMAVTRTAITTQHPDDLVVTNTYNFLGDSDVDQISIGGGSEDEQEIILSVRPDQKVTRQTYHLSRIRSEGSLACIACISTNL